MHASRNVMIIKSQQQTTQSPLNTSETQRPANSEHMDFLEYDERPGRRIPWKWLFVAFVLVVAVGLAGPLNRLRSHFGKPPQDLVLFTVERDDLPIVVTERGNLESQINIEILCEVDEIRTSGHSGTAIVWLIPNGTSVKAGDLLIELDSAPHQERLDQQILETDRTRANQIQAQAKHENQITQNETSLADAELDVRLAELEVEMFTDEESGTRRLEVDAIERLIDDVNNEIRSAQANLMLRENEKRGIETLFKLGYAGKGELDRISYDFLRAENEFATRVNRLKTQMATLSKLQNYDLNMQSLKLHGRLETTRRRLEQVQRNNEALTAQSQAALDAANQALAKEEERLERYKDQLEKCRIYAPQDGMVAYAVSASRWNREEIREGATVRQRQHLLSLPNLNQMQVKTAVHESVVDQIEPGLSATVRLDAFADRVYRASVRSVAVLPDPGGFLSSDTKVYETVVTIDEEVQQLKPGMTAVVEIHVDRLEDVISIPVQAIVQVQNQTWCYVEQQGLPVRRPLRLGRSNDKFVHIVEGLEEGERVVLNPMAIFDETRQRDERIDADMDDLPVADDVAPAADVPALPAAE
ncbi:MAG: efflux RND transporter periplasmic adaptor subunit [Planctomycetaceae bacterium]|nr:MAG: efflux RND transporter periplasmic adaptor subunit [Planctomycetaceae bacterium]